MNKMLHIALTIIAIAGMASIAIAVCRNDKNQDSDQSETIINNTTASTSTHETDVDTVAFTKWIAGSIVSENSVKKYGIERCFVSFRIDNATFKRIENRSYKKGCPTTVSNLRYLRLLHVSNDGKIKLGEMICNKAIARDLIEIFRELYEARYPIERITLIDEFDADDEKSMSANNTSCFNFRTIGNSAKLSCHSTGRAVDVNPLYNPYVKRRGGKVRIQPANAEKYANRTDTFPYKITRNDLCVILFKKHGFKWGGDWRTAKDYQHFEKKR